RRRVQRLGRGCHRLRPRRSWRQHGAADSLFDRCRHSAARSGQDEMDDAGAARRDRPAHARRRRRDRQPAQERLRPLTPGGGGRRVAAGARAESCRKKKKRVLRCAAYHSGEEGIKTLYGGVPAVIGARGVERIVEIQLNGAERAMFEQSAEAVATLVEACKKIAPNLAK